MAERDGGDKRHPATERRLRQAAARGDIRRSADLPKAAAVVAMTALALGASAGIGARLQDDCAAWLSAAGTATPAAAAGWATILVLEIAPLLMLIAATGAVASFVSGGWVFTLTP